MRLASISSLVVSAIVVIAGCQGDSNPVNEQPGPTITYRVYGLNFSPYLELDPNQGAVVTAERIGGLLDVIAPYCRWIRTYGSTHGLEQVPEMAKARGLSIAASCWLSGDHDVNTSEVAGLIEMASAGTVDLAIVGTEVLLRGDLSESELLAYMREVKATGVPVTTADTWDQLLAHPAIVAECDVVMVNIYPYWEGVPVESAVRSVHDHYLKVQEIAGDKEVIVGETGWPSAGNQVGEAIPSPENAAYYFLNFVSWARAEHVNYFYFEAFDEIWKASYEGPQGAHWGIWDRTGHLKPGMNSVFDGETVPNNWDITAQPSIEFTYVPPYGSFQDLRGRVTGVNASDYRVAVYIYVNGWWTKPYWISPLTPISFDGTWTCDITTGGTDQYATRIVAFLVPDGYNPPLMRGAQTLPAELEQNAVASIEIARSPSPTP